MPDIFIVPFNVKPSVGSIMPTTANGAYVSCYAQAKDYKQAVMKCIEALDADGMQVEEVLQPIHSMDASQWSQHIVDQWPDQASQMPNQEEFERAIASGKVIYGPFGAY